MTWRLITATAFVATVVAANAALAAWGTVPVGFGLEAPAGVYFAGLAFGLRDVLHELGGRRWVLAAIGIGSVVSLYIEDAATIPGGYTSIAVASAAAFALSELADLAVYAPLRERNWPAAVTLSQIAGAAVDSLLFLTLAFGTLDTLPGLLVGKVLMVVPALMIMGGIRRAVPRDTVEPADA